MLKRFNELMTHLVVDEQKMLDNINLTNGVIFSQRIMLYLIENKGYERVKAYEIIQKCAQEAFTQDINFGEILVRENLITKEEYATLTSLDYYLTNIANVFKRLN